MEVTVMETGDLPASTVISFHTGTIRRHAQVEKNKAINLSHVSGVEPIRVDLMSQVGSHTFEMVPGQDVYEVPIKAAQADDKEVKLKFQIRDAKAAGRGKKEASDAAGSDKAAGGKDGEYETNSPASPSRKLQTALMMRSYLDNHDVLRQMQELLQDMVTNRPEDPIEYMILRLEEVCQDTQDIALDCLDANVNKIIMADNPTSDIVKPPETKPAEPAKAEPSKEAEKAKADDSEEEDDEDDVADMPGLTPMPQAAPRTRKQSVSAEAYGAFNQRQAYQPKVIAKDDSQKKRINKVLRQCWMFKDYTQETLNVVIDAMAEKLKPPNVQLIQQGDEGNAMWVIEEGTLECFKTINGEEKLVKTCLAGDVFGELALLYSCPRAASVFTKDKCVLWELDRDTFRAICYEAAQGMSGPEYEGFNKPGSSNQEPAAKAADAEDEGGSDDEGEAAEPVAPVKTGAKPRRQGVSAEAMQDDGDYTPPIHPKTAEEREGLSNIIKTSHDSKLHMLFGTANKETFEKIIDATFSKKITLGEHVIEQGDVGDYFYIVRSGKFDIIVQKGEDPPKKVFEAGAGFAFGELALLYNAPRSATITASEESEVWCLDRAAFRNLVVRSAEAQFKQYVEFLNGVDIFQVLNSNERASLAEVLEEEEFEDDEAILEQGEKDDKMFILREGKAVACIKGDQGEVEVKQYEKGDYFGEIALLLGEPRKASVYAVGSCTCLYISRETFLRILGPLHELLERNVGKYEKYQDAIAAAATEEQAPKRNSVTDTAPEGDDEFHGGGAKGKTKMVNRKRDRGQDQKAAAELEKMKETKKVAQEAASDEPQSLADKVAADFKNPRLVQPSEDFVVPSIFTVYGGLILGQKFTHDKKLLFRNAPSARVDGEDEVYSWNQTTKLKGMNEMAVLCQKGQKSAADPTPNQDNFFVHSVGSVEMYGVADGHGPFGHLVSFRLVQTLPCLLTNNPNFGKDWAQALKEAFVGAQKDLIEFCSAENINIEASGAACSVLVLEEQTVHIAFIGDARVMLGSWNRRDSRMIFCTTDHKPQNEGEMERLQGAGSEVREIDSGNFRIYLPGSNFPGLTMSRAFGDTACAGVLQEPEYHRFLMQPKDEWYAIVGSDGIWEFIDGEEACSMTAKKLRLKGARETLNFLIQASRKRWQYCCGEYCDDITGVLIQWNAHDKKGGDGNHSLTVKRPAE